MRPATKHLLLGGLFGVGRPAGNLLGGEIAGAAFDFINMDMLIRGANPFSGNPNDKLTYTSPSTKWVRNSAGVYVSGTTLRTDYLANGTALGLLVEGQFTNVLLRSQEFDNAAWTKTDTTVTANATTSPDGTANADLLTEGTAGTAFARQTGTATVASAAVSGSIFLKASANVTWMQVILRDSTNVNGLSAWINLSTGAIGTVSNAGTATGSGAQVVAAANGFWRLECWCTMPAAVSDLLLRMQSASADNNSTRVNNAAYYAWQARAGLGARPSSPVVATTAAVTRAADDISILLNALPYSATGGTLIATVRAPNVIGVQSIVTLDDGTGSESIRLRSVSGSMNAIIYDGGVVQADLSDGTLSANTVMKVAVAWAANDIAYCANGGTVQTDASATLPTLTALRFGARNALADPLGGHLQTVRLLPRRASNSELQAFTT